MRAVAVREGVPVIELHDMTRTFFETLGYEGSKRSLCHYKAGTFPGQVKELADNTHFNAYGAYEVSKMIVMGLKQLNMPVVSRLRPDWQDYSPAVPDDVNTFQWFEAARYDNTIIRRSEACSLSSHEMNITPSGRSILRINTKRGYIIQSHLS